jgi:uncharacterized protein YbjT (DUF2867 family)
VTRATRRVALLFPVVSDLIEISTSMSTVLVAGASGVLGKEILEALNARGLSADALVRDERKLGTHRSLAENVRIADARDVTSLKGTCDGVGAVISTVGASQRWGATKDKSTFFDIDYHANKNLLDECVRAGVNKFVYVSLCNGNTTLKDTAYAAAHETLVGELERSGLDYAVIRPTGFFDLFDETLRQARRGRATLIGDGRAKTNPVHEADVAASCVDALASHEKDIGIGGPDILTRREIAEIPFEILGKKPRITAIPAALVRASIVPLKLFDRRTYDLAEFSIAAFTTEIVAPPVGRSHLRDYLIQLIANT